LPPWTALFRRFAAKEAIVSFRCIQKPELLTQKKIAAGP